MIVTPRQTFEVSPADAARNAIRRSIQGVPHEGAHYFFGPKGAFHGYYPDFDTAYATALLVYDYASKEKNNGY